MSDLTSLEAAKLAAGDPATTAADLAAIVQNHPDLGSAVARHPNAYPDLLDWLTAYGDDDAKQAVAARRAAATAPTPAGPPPPPPATLAPPSPPVVLSPPAVVAPPPLATIASPAPPTPAFSPLDSSTIVRPNPAIQSVGQPAPSRRRRLWIPILAGVLVIALAGAGVVFGVPGTSFHGLLKPGDATGTGSANPNASPQPNQASFANGYQTTWTVTAASLGITAAQAGESLDQLALTPVAHTDTTWLIGVYGRSNGMTVFGVDATTGQRKWGSMTNGSFRVCADQPIGHNFYCGEAGTIVALDQDSGTMATVATVFGPGPIPTTTGSVRLNYDVSEAGFILRVVGDTIIAMDVDQSNFTLVSALSATGQVLWTSQAPISPSCGPTPPPDVKTGGIIVLNVLCQAVAFDATSGAILTSADCPLAVVADATLAGCGATGTRPTSTTFTGSDQAKWTAWQLPDSSIVFPASATAAPIGIDQAGTVHWWATDTSQANWSAPIDAFNPTGAYDGRHLLLTDERGDAWSLSPADGTVVWHTSLRPPGDNTSQPILAILADGTVLATINNTLSAFDPDSGDLYWSMPTSWTYAPILTATTPAGGPLVVPDAANATLSRLDPTTPQPRVPSMPASLPSCPQDWTPVAWSTWSGGHTLVCAQTGQQTYHLELTVGAQQYTTDQATRSPTGAYVGQFDSGASVVVSLGGGLIQFTDQATTASYAASAAWDHGVAGGFSLTPVTDVPACPSGSYPLSLSIWTGQWLLTCGVDATVTTFSYYNGTAAISGNAMTAQADKTCGPDAKGDVVCYSPSVVTVTSNGITATYPTASTYVTGSGQNNSFTPSGTIASVDPEQQALTNIDAEIAYDTPVAESYLVGQWTPQLSAKWDGLDWNGQTWNNQAIWDQFQGFKDKYSTSLLLHSSDWSNLGLSDPKWYTMVAGISFSDPDSTNYWCYSQGYDPGNCFAVQLGYGAAQHTMKMWKPSDFGG